MALTARHLWMAQKVAQAFPAEVDEDEAKAFFLSKKSVITPFLTSLQTPPKLLFFLQPRAGTQGQSELVVSTGENDKIKSKCVYFLRNSDKPINTTVGSDERVMFGELSSSVLQVLENTISTVFEPLLQAPGAWGQMGSNDKERRAFLKQTQRFAADVRKRADNLRGDLELQVPRPPFDRVEQKPAAYEEAARNDELVRHFHGILKSWCQDITAYIQNDPSSVPLDRSNSTGPDVEIDYWARRLPTLVSVTEQLKGRRSRVVTGVLKVRAQTADEAEERRGASNAAAAAAAAGGAGAEERGGLQDETKALLERWREVDMLITDALNEAKDNIRFLGNLRKVIEPLYTDAPAVIAEAMPSLMNSMKMIHTLSRHYGTTVRMTNLFERVSNQLITRCKEEIYGGEPAQKLWKQPPLDIVGKMRASIRLFDAYTTQYQDTKAKLAAMPKGKQFDLDPARIFHKPTLFCRRLEKLIDMFSSIEQFRALERKRIDGMERLIASFDQLINDFKLKGHDLLDYNSTAFERDFVEYTMHNSGLENAIQEFLGRSLQQMNSIEKQLHLMSKFKGVLHREALQEDLEHKYLAIFHAYGKDLLVIQQLYEKHRNDPPIPRNMPRIAGNIHWSRQLLRRITLPMSQFQQNPKVFHPKESKKVIRHYNKLVQMLIAFEHLWFQAWQKSTEAAKRGLRSPLIVEAPAAAALAAAVVAVQPGPERRLLLNFDQGVLELMREAKHLQLLGFAIPNSAKTVLLLQDKLKAYHNKLAHTLQVYNAVVDMLRPEVRALLGPHLSDLHRTIKPALTSMTWTSLNIEPFLAQLHTVLSRFEQLVTHLNDVITNRIQKNLELVGRLMLVHQPPAETFALRDFAAAQRKHLEQCTAVVTAKNVEVERAVDDLLQVVQAYPLDASVERTSAEQSRFVKMHFCQLMYHALLTATKTSLSVLMERMTFRRVVLIAEEPAKAEDGTENAAGEEADAAATTSPKEPQPLFEVDLNLQVPEVVFAPRLQQLQETVSQTAKDMMRCTAQLMDWGLDDTAVERARRPFYQQLAADKAVAAALLQLNGAIEDTARHADEQLVAFQRDFEWLWKKEPEEEYARFVAAGGKQERLLDDFIAELHKFVAEEGKIDGIPAKISLGALLLRTSNLRQQLKNETDRWKFQYSEKLHQEARRDMEDATELMKDLKSKLERQVKDFASLKFVMDAQSELRDVQASIDIRFLSILERYAILETYLPAGVMTKEEMDAKSMLKTEWATILALADDVMERVSSLQGGFKKDLVEKVAEFKLAVRDFRVDYDANGPMVEGTTPEEAMTRLNKFKREFESLQRKFELYNGGEKLFGLPEQQYPDLVQAGKELRLLDQLYSLYQAVITTVDQYKEIPWAEVVANIQTMNETVEALQNKCRKLPKQLRSWPAYEQLSKTISDFIEILPLLTELSKPAMRARHWQQISQLTGQDFDLRKFNELKLRQVLEANLNRFREEIEEITDGAEKQLGIEKKIHDIVALWDSRTFAFSAWKERGEVILNGGEVGSVVEQLEESQAALIQMLTMRHVTPFRENATVWLKKLSEVNDALENWIKVQQLWMSLEAVFTGGDIARQMPQDTRVFMNVDKEWTTRLMHKAKDVKNVVECCTNEYIKNMLPSMFVDLEKCQKALDGYLEAKRARFPRFYFVSNSALLIILSQGSDKDAVQSAFAKIFDSLERVEFKGNAIIKMRSLQSGFEGAMDSEDIPLTKAVTASGNIEDWMDQLLVEMRRTIKDIVRAGAADFEAMPLGDFIAKYCAQVSLLGIQFMWTNDVQEALMRCKHDKKAVETATAKQQSNLDELSAMTTKDIPTKMERTKVETLVTIQVHQRDVLDTLRARFKRKEIKDAGDFEWQKQLRCYWVPEDDECVVRIADVDFNYCHEYLGCKERLVVTPLTDRCYVSLSQAIGMFFGGAPAGPAGTGKTETVKDLGRALGKYVVVFNCSDQMHTPDTAKIYKGLCQSGSWGCFDEFNRIDLEVLSVVAQQVMAIFNAMRMRAASFTFPGDSVGEVTLDPRCGVFITMNPGYAGRQELPENLKALFRGVAMMVPDREIIMKVKLASVGYTEFVKLAKKFRVLYNLCEEQLSKQRHYDFGLRNILSVLRTAGVNLRLELQQGSSLPKAELEEMLMMRTLRDMNLSKLVADDVGLFISLLHDLFPNQKDPEKRRYDAEEEAMRKVIQRMGLVHHESWVNKIVQLYETSLVRHGLMMVGPAGGGKTTATKVLLEALSECKEKHAMVRMNPKAITAEQMFGQNDLISGEWTHGVFSSLWFKYNDVKKHRTWIVCDGPVDAIWIENLNTVLDDNKLLTLANGDRSPMTDNVRLLFEVQDLRNASPATVSRAGIIFVSDSDLGHGPLVEAWLSRRREDERALLRPLFEKYVEAPAVFDWLSKNVTHVMPVLNTHLVTNLIRLLEALLLDAGGPAAATAAAAAAGAGGAVAADSQQQKLLPADALERLFVYAYSWSLGGLLEAADRGRFHAFVNGLAGPALPKLEGDATVFDYYVATDSPAFDWRAWKAPEWAYPATGFKFSSCLVPTVDSVRAEFLLDRVSRSGSGVLVVGSSGTAKTSIVTQYTRTFDPAERLLKKVNFSSATTANMFQTSIEADIEKRQGKTYAPSGGRRMAVFLDDLNMPEVNNWGDQPTLEIVRQLVETGGFYFLEKDKRGDRMAIENLFFLAAMSHPGGGRNDIPQRLKRHFFCFNVTPPSQQTIDNIYGSMLRGRFAARKELQQLVPSMTEATINLWSRVKARMLPTPSKFHYIFNMRDLSRIFQGVLHAPQDVIGDPQVLLRLWHHECARVLSDKLTNEKDQQWYEDAALKVVSQFFGNDTARSLKEQKEPSYFVDYLRDAPIDPETGEPEDEAPKVYEQVRDVPAMRSKVNALLAKYNEQPGVKTMDLVLFTDALQHMMRISRIIGMPRGNALLVGVGGSGRQSLTRLAAYIANHQTFQISITRGYKLADFMEDIRKLYVKVGKEGKKVTWIFTDFEILHEDFLEYINAILATGEVAGLFPKDERDMMCSDLRGPAKKENPAFEDTPENLYKYFLDRIRDNLHIVLCFSPANERFAERARRFPGLISGCTIDWFLRWPTEALEDVSAKFVLQDPNLKIECQPEVAQALVAHIASVHKRVVSACDEYFQRYRRAVYVTPKSYLSFIQAYKTLYTAKLAAVSLLESNVRSGLQKLKQAEVDVARMQVELEQQQKDLAEADRAATAMIKELEEGAKRAAEQKAIAHEIESSCKSEAEVINREKEQANKELEAAMPFVHAAEEAANSVNKKDIGVIQRLGTPPDLIKRIMDCVLILNLRPLDPVKMTKIKTGKDETLNFITDSYDTQAKKMMVEKDFTSTLLSFATSEKDRINEETMEFLEPYLAVHDFTADRARTVSSAAEGLCKWVRAMHDYHLASLVVGPRLEQLQIKSGLFEVAMSKLQAAQGESKKAQDEVSRLERAFAKTMAEKATLEQKARATMDKMRAASDLIQSLATEKARWADDADKFANDKLRLVGDCALACAFVSYCGPFNHEFRKSLIGEQLVADATQRRIPLSENLNINKFLVDAGTIAEWNSQGLPKDELSIQNGILVTQASRFPLLIDPQGQALSWLKKRESSSFPVWGTTVLNNPKLRDQLEFCLEEGKPLLIEGVVKEVDPMLDPVLDRNVKRKGRALQLQLGDKMVTFDPAFRMYLVTKLANPIFSPELSAKTTVIDFSVTQKGLEEQLLSRVIQQEQAQLEEQRVKLTEEVNMNTIALQRLDKLLLDRLGASKTNLLDDVELINVLADTKHKAKEVQEKIQKAAETELSINQKREQYRAVATRGSVLYFTIVEMSQVNCMYQTSLHQFLSWFDGALQSATKANLVAKRVQLLIDELTYSVYVNVDRGLFEKDKLTFKLMVTLKVMLTETDLLAPEMLALLLRGGAVAAAVEEKAARRPFDWMQDSSWVGVTVLNRQLDFFRDLKSSLTANEAEWRRWYEAEAPEELPIPVLEQRLQTHPSGPFLRLLLLRCLRDDRLRLAANIFIGAQLGQRYTEPIPVRLDRVWQVSNNRTPVILLLTPGADPTSSLEELAKKKGLRIFAVSMGEGQEKHAQKCLEHGMREGGWALLQNCHLGLGFMNSLDEELKRAFADEQHPVSEAFRLWITCEPHPDFPINLLQLGIKVTNEPPAGMKAGLVRSYNTVVDEDRLARVGDSKEWRDLVFSTCYLHSVVQERRKFGPVGWCIPYEYNQSDLEASLTFLERHFFAAAQAGLSWETIQYMICEVQYGGRITDDFDRVLFNTLGKAWLNQRVFDASFEFTRVKGGPAGDFRYAMPAASSLEEYRTFLAKFPNHDSPELFGLHQNADLTFGTNEGRYILNTIADTQPKQSGAALGGKTREEAVSEQAAQLLKALPEGYDLDDVRARIRKRPKAELQQVLGDTVSAAALAKVDGFQIPLNIFLFQEISRLQGVLDKVRSTLQSLIQAINGEVIMTPELQNALNAIFDGKPPRSWYRDASGATIAWVMPSLALWFNGLLEREKQLSSWLNDKRPLSYWLTGFFNPQGFLTAVRQEVTRRHNNKDEKWALDDVVLVSRVTELTEARAKKAGKLPDEGVFVHGLCLEGCSWDEKARCLTESPPKELFAPLPVLHVSAATTKRAEAMFADGRFYDCPVYTRPQRTGQAYVFTVKLPSQQPPDHWVLRGVALLCSKD